MDEEEFKQKCPNLYDAIQKAYEEEKKVAPIEFAGLQWKFFDSYSRYEFVRNFITRPTTYTIVWQSKCLGTVKINEN